jgi:putative inorganic carbon (hco3(-)) transporter
LGIKAKLIHFLGYDATQPYGWLVWLEPALVILLAPVFLFPAPHKSILFTFIILLFVLHFLARRRIVEPSPINALLMLLLSTVLMSLVATYDPVFSLPKIAGVLLGAAVYWAIINYAISPRSLAFVMAATLLGIAIFAGLALVGTQWVIKVSVLGSITARLPHWIKGVQGAEEGFYPNAVAGVLILFLPLQIGLAHAIYRNSRSHKALLAALWAGIGLSIGVVLLSQSRGGWLGLGVAALLLIILKRCWGRWLAAALVCGGILLGIWLGPEKIGNSASKIIGSASNAAAIYDMRMALWDRAICGIKDFPLTGMGMNTFRKVMYVEYPLFIKVADRNIANCHNQWLQTALDLGVPGLIAYMALLSAAIAMGVQVWQRSEHSWIRAAAKGLVCGIIAQQIFGITDAIALGAKVGIFFWIALGMLAAMHRLTMPALITIGRKPFRFGLMDTVITWLLIALLAILFIANHPLAALFIALIGGIALGIAWVTGFSGVLRPSSPGN